MKPIAWAIKERIADDDEYTDPWAGIYCNPDTAKDDANALESTCTSRFDVVPLYGPEVLEMLARERERADRHEGAVRAYIEDADAMRMQRDDALIKLAKVMEGLRETYEIYAGMETTPLPILASEAYLLRIIDQMQKSVTALLRTIEGETPG